MVKFLRLSIDRVKGEFQNISYLPDVLKLARSFKNKLFDDFFFQTNENFVPTLISLIERTSPYFWVVTDNKKRFAGLIFLDDWQGSCCNPYCASVTTCILPEFWGKFTKFAGKKFLRYVFKRFKLKKLKAEVYSGNNRTHTLLLRIGFKHEYKMVKETLVRGTPIDIDVYSLFNPFK